MKKKCILILLTLLCAAGACFGALPAMANSEDPDGTQPAPVSPQAETVSVVGTGKIVVHADSAEICLGIETRAENLADGHKKNAEIFQNVLAALKQSGMERTDSLLTDHIGAYPIRDDDKDEFMIVRDLRFRTKDFARAEELAATLAEAGANRFNGIRYSLDNTDTAFKQALALARTDAISKAEALQSGLTLSDLCEMGIYWHSAPNTQGEITVEASVRASFHA